MKEKSMSWISQSGATQGSHPCCLVVPHIHHGDPTPNLPHQPPWFSRCWIRAHGVYTSIIHLSPCRRGPPVGRRVHPVTNLRVWKSALPWQQVQHGLFNIWGGDKMKCVRITLPRTSNPPLLCVCVRVCVCVCVCVRVCVCLCVHVVAPMKRWNNMPFFTHGTPTPTHHTYTPAQLHLFNIY